MNKPSVASIFQEAKRQGRKVLIPYIMGGYPDRSIFPELLVELTKGGADLIEVGFPFSDPLADGVSIQQASEKVLADAMNADDIFKMTASVEHQIAPLIFMTYFNVVYKYGVDKFLKKARASGFSGAIIPDLPVEERKLIADSAKRNGIETIFLLAPTSTPARIKDTVKHSSGFIYCVSLTGVTGARASISKQLPDFIKKVRRETDTPLAIGFGISKPEHAVEVCKYADGAIVGSALINVISESVSVDKNKQGGKASPTSKKTSEQVRNFTSGFRKALDKTTFNSGSNNKKKAGRAPLKRSKAVK